MDKLIFFFHRKDGLTREEFAEHYLDVHAPLGLRVTVTMDGYSVNLVDSDDDSVHDAITEVWTASSADFFDPAKSFATPEDVQQLMADHDSFIGPFDTYVVEERVVRGDADVPSGVKRVSCYLEGDAIAEPGQGVTDVLEQRVVQVLNSDAPVYATIVSTWAPTVDSLGPSSAVAYDVHEYRKKLAVA